MNTKSKKAAKAEAKSNRRKTIAARKKAEQATIEKRAKAYLDMENHVCELATAAKLAMVVFESKDLFLFAVDHLDTMAQRFRANYYAEEFSPACPIGGDQ
jgi:hypothetical protein